jgi:FKBP-type peptidyl-prolyl cis-trans isomerase FkpA
MNIRNISLAAIAGFMILSVSSCLKDDGEELRAEEKRILKEYILSNNISVAPTASGLYYIESLAGTGDSAKLGTWMEIKYTGRLLANNDVVMTNDMQVAKDNDIFQESFIYGPTRLLGTNYAGINQGISMMREGGKARLIFPSDLGLGGSSTQYIPAYSSMIFDIELLKVIPDFNSYENGLMMEYLQANGISTDSTGSGIYFKEITAGTGDLPVEGKLVTMSFTGKYLNGAVFDKSIKPATFILGIDRKIPGFEEGIKMIRNGGSATIVIPYYYAYGEYGKIDEYNRVLIPPFTTLVFDISVTNIVK